MMLKPPVLRSLRPKLVVAHFMVGNTYPYTVADWQADIKLACDSGFDGFALNIGCEDWQLSRVSDCFNAVLLYPNFKLFFSFDMISIPSTKQGDITLILEYLQKFSHHQSYLKHAGGIVVSTFAGQESFFGFDSLNEAWVYVKQTIEKSISRPVQFIPSFFIDPRTYPSLSCMNGYFHWNGGWPIHLQPQSPHHEIHFPSLDSDQAHLCHLGRRTYMAAISPWFFTHYGKDSWNKNWIYRGDDHLLIRRWEYLLSIRDQVDIVQVISWNDYGESHYISPVRGAQPNSQSWVDDCPHNSWLSINHLFIHAFKNVGAYEKTEEMTGLFHSIPHGIFTNAGMTDVDDIIWLWSRPHSKYATARNDSVGKPDNWELTDDLFWVVTLTCSPNPTILKLSTGASDHRPTIYQIPPSHGRRNEGQPTRRLSKFSHRLLSGEGIRAELFRDGRLVATCDPGSNFKFEKHPEIYNFNVVVFSSLENGC